jgi:hypothetical protein
VKSPARPLSRDTADVFEVEAFQLRLLVWVYSGCIEEEFCCCLSAAVQVRAAVAVGAAAALDVNSCLLPYDAGAGNGKPALLQIALNRLARGHLEAKCAPAYQIFVRDSWACLATAVELH